MAEFRRKVVRLAIIPEPLDHLLTDMKGMYTYDSGDTHIMLDGKAAAYMRCNAFMLKAALGHMIAMHLEGINP